MPFDNKKLVASTALFAELINANKDLKTVINEFILSVFMLEPSKSFDSVAVKNALIDHYDFDIPELIVRSQLSKIVKEGKLFFTQGSFSINPTFKVHNHHLSEDFQTKHNEFQIVEKQLLDYVKLHHGILNSEDINKILACFPEYLFDNNIDDEYSRIISAFLIKHKSDPNFTHYLNQIREGVIILKGIQYTDDFNKLEEWKNELTIYLDTEHLLSLQGYNGEAYKDTLMEFYELVREINHRSNGDGKKIFLKILPQTELEVNKFFYVAKKILKGHLRLTPGKTAMENILANCAQETDVTRKESKFFVSLRAMGVLSADDLDLMSHPEYNLVDQSILNKYSEVKTEEDIVEILKTFTYINIKRQGQNKKSFEKIGHILLTGDKTVRLMSTDDFVKMDDADFSFATDIFYVTKRLWFRLNKGLGFSRSLPASLDIIRKAQIVISNQIKSKVSERFDRIVQDLEDGSRKDDEIRDYYLRLRKDALNPEEINDSNLEETLELLYLNDDLENFKREQSSLKSKAKERDEIYLSLEEERKNREKDKLVATATQKKLLFDSCKFKFKIFSSIFWVFVVVCFGIIIWMLYKLKTNNDTPIQILIAASSLFGLIVYKFIPQLRREIKSRSFKSYINQYPDETI